ncbi:hypothetical protein ACFL35_10840 [Candidatus Riflebacteria bacterium]
MIYSKFNFDKKHKTSTSGSADVPTPAASRQEQKQIESLQDDVERLLMITEALWAMLKEEHGYEDEKLVEMITEIDLRDGKLDGRVAIDDPEPCPNCKRKLQRNRNICIYCGTSVQKGVFAR